MKWPSRSGTLSLQSFHCEFWAAQMGRTAVDEPKEQIRDLVYKGEEKKSNL
jgi:hypothetical protein